MSGGDPEERKKYVQLVFFFEQKGGRRILSGAQRVEGQL